MDYAAYKQEPPKIIVRAANLRLQRATSCIEIMADILICSKTYHTHVIKTLIKISLHAPRNRHRPHILKFVNDLSSHHRDVWQTSCETLCIGDLITINITP
jgi:hypothetical protein